MVAIWQQRRGNVLARQLQGPSGARLLLGAPAIEPDPKALDALVLEFGKDRTRGQEFALFCHFATSFRRDTLHKGLYTR